MLTSIYTIYCIFGLYKLGLVMLLIVILVPNLKKVLCKLFVFNSDLHYY